MGIADNIIVNDFMFCRDHGFEYCYRCCCDHRMCNNVRVEDELGGIAEATGFDYEVRFKAFFLVLTCRDRKFLGAQSDPSLLPGCCERAEERQTPV